MANEASRAAGRRALKRIKEASIELQGLCFGLDEADINRCAEASDFLTSAEFKIMKVIGFR